MMIEAEEEDLLSNRHLPSAAPTAYVPNPEVQLLQGQHIANNYTPISTSNTDSEVQLL